MKSLKFPHVNTTLDHFPNNARNVKEMSLHSLVADMLNADIILCLKFSCIITFMIGLLLLNQNKIIV